MTGQITDLVRHPIKSHGRETMASVSLEAGQTMPWDRTWAVVHEASQADGSEWVPCQNFSRVSKSADLSAIDARFDAATNQLTLTHPRLPELTFCPDTQGDRLIEWSRPLIPDTRAASKRVVRGQKRGFTDSDFASVTLCNRSSHRAVEQRVGRPLSIHRWRGNIWFDGLAPWEEFDWMDREVQIGDAIVIPRERTDRCIATHSNPETGRADVDILAALDTWDHRDFSVRAEVVQGGMITLGSVIHPL